MFAGRGCDITVLMVQAVSRPVPCSFAAPGAPRIPSVSLTRLALAAALGPSGLGCRGHGWSARPLVCRRFMRTFSRSMSFLPAGKALAGKCGGPPGPESVSPFSLAFTQGHCIKLLTGFFGHLVGMAEVHGCGDDSSRAHFRRGLAHRSCSGLPAASADLIKDVCSKLRIHLVESVLAHGHFREVFRDQLSVMSDPVKSQCSWT